jgi:4-hydroxybenzoate polyprenyltransferase
MTYWMKRASSTLFSLYQFIHFSVLGFSIILPLLSAATVSSQLTTYQILMFVGVAVTYHIFGYVLNDVIDLPLDRTQPLRSASPLVQGLIQPWIALTVALFQIPLALAFTFLLNASSLAYVILALGFGLVVVYNVWGKRSPFPVLTDVVQGIGFGALVLYGAVGIPGHHSELIGVIFAFVVVFIVMINGIHGSLRDLTNDLNNGAQTTAIFLGVRPLGTEGIILPLRFRFYTLSLQLLLISIVLLPLLNNWFGYPLIAWRVTFSIVITFILLSLILLIVSAASTSNHPRLSFAGMLHISVSLSLLIVVFVSYIGSGLRWVLLIIYIVPLCSNSILWNRLMRSTGKRKSMSLGK